MKKSEKKIPLKKLPSLYRKSYSKKKLVKKILSKIYIPQDKEKVSSLYELTTNQKGKEIYAIPLDKTFTPDEIKFYKNLAKEIKSQKGRIRFLPLIATVSFIFIAVSIFSIFKNPLIKKILDASLESIFTAKVEISSVDLRFLDASFRVNNLSVGNKNQEFKNLFEFEKLDLDFNLSQLLCGRFNAQNIEVSGMVFNTDRTTSCLLPKKEKKAKKKNQQNPLVKEFNNKSNKAIEELKVYAASLVGGTDVDTIVNNIYSELKTPTICAETKEKSILLVEKWKTKPQELSQKVESFMSSAENLKSVDLSTKDLNELKKNLALISDAISETKKLSNEIESVYSDIKKDSDQINKMKNQISSSVKNDTDFAKSKISEFTDLFKNSKTIIKNAVDTIAYSFLGSYYPYVQKLTDYVLQIKKNSSAKVEKKNVKTETVKKEKKVKKVKKEVKRLNGTTYWYASRYPSFLINRIFVSGEGFSAELIDLSNNQNILGKPAVLKSSFSLKNVKHDVSAIVDVRDSSSDSLITASYKGSGYNLNFDGTKIAKSSGIPSLNSTSDISLTAKIDENLFKAYGDFDLNSLSLSSDGIGNEKFDKYYNQALASINDLDMSYNLDIKNNENIDLNFSGNYVDEFVKALSNTAIGVGNDVTNQIMDKVSAKLSDSSSESLKSFADFDKILSEVNSSKEKINSYKNSLEAKKLELTKSIENYGKNVVNGVTEKASDAAKNATKNAAKNLLNSLQKKN